MKIAVFLPNWIGDVVMATPAVRALRDTFPAAELVAVSKPYVQGVLEGAPWFAHHVPLDGRGKWSRRWPGAALRLRRLGIDLAVLFPNSFRSALVAWLGGCRRRVGFNRYGRGLLLTDRLEPLRDAAGKYQPTPIIDDYNRLVEKAGCASPGHRMELFTTAADESGADAVWNKYRFDEVREVVCLNPGAAFGAAKHWSSASFAEVARTLIQRRRCGVLVLCGPGERELARAIVAQTSEPGIFSLADEKLSLGLTKALVRRSTLLVTTDSGPRHFAAAFGRPVVTLFGPTHIEWTDTFFPAEIHLQKKVPCGPCQQRVCPLDHRCMKELTPAEVLAAAERLLSGGYISALERKAS